MSSGYKVSKLLKTIRSNTNERTHKAMFLANALGYSVDLTNCSLDEAVAEYTPMLKKLTTSVNQHTPLDAKLAESLFVKVLRIRFELITGVTDPAVLFAAVRSETSDLYSTAVESAINESLTSSAEFAGITNSLLEILAEE